jgi:hypothetical protein
MEDCKIKKLLDWVMAQKLEHPPGNLTVDYYQKDQKSIAYQMYIKKDLYLAMENKLLIPVKIIRYIIQLAFLKTTEFMFSIPYIIENAVFEKSKLKIVAASIIKNCDIVDVIFLLLNDDFNKKWQELDIGMS